MKTEIVYTPQNVCCKQIKAELEDNRIISVSFENGCPGNLQGISKLVKGMDINDVVSKLHGIKCGPKDTSCPDQLAGMLEQWQREASGSK